MKKIVLFVIMLGLSLLSVAQQPGEIKGFVYNKKSGEGLAYSTIVVKNKPMGAMTDENGFYSLGKVKPGTYTIYALVVGYDTVYETVTVKPGQTKMVNLNLTGKSNRLGTARIDIERKRSVTTTKIGEINITPKQLTQIPTVGGEPDLVQYLQVLPGVVFSGDQGGQLYIRGGSPIMNKVLLDGMTIYNPFHSIGLFSVFDTDILKSTDVYSAGFSAEYGGRISAVVDVQTRDGNRSGFRGKLNVNPFTSKVLLEGPLRGKKKEGRANTSYIVSYKNSFLDESSKLFYGYVGDDQLPYSFSDLYTKLSFNSNSGSFLKLFYFDYNDLVDFPNTTTYNWKSNGFGGKFLLVPQESKNVIDGSFAYSNYNIDQIENDAKPRSSGINGFNLGLNFTYFFPKSKLKYGLELNGFQTNFQIFNAVNRKITQENNTTELAGFVNYNTKVWNIFIFEPGLRMQRYASLGNTSWEPRFRFKYLINTRLRFKVAAGLYSQNLLSASSDRDVVNLFYGFLSGPEELPGFVGTKPVTHRMQTSQHLVGGFELDVDSISTINIEGYAKDFTQITNINRDKIYDDNLVYADKPEHLRKDYVVETGLAYGFDVTYKRQTDRWYLWLVYSYNNVSRYDGIRRYQPHFDRRHNINVVTSYSFGEDGQWEANLRWNFGSGFPFTLTQGFYENLSFANGTSEDYRTANGDFTVVYDDINRGRLPYYHRLDASIKRTYVFKMEKGEPRRLMEVIASCTNVYNRDNIFYFDRVSYTRVNQLPILPSLSVSYKF
ncbi:MAG: TonB-dependent receptor [Bacteroidia bacterium]|nr:TonB-dependent receptor [Bacteroidia bacterium]